ncbi:MAG: DUF1499 domain-containing protein [Rhodobiaceae bacterium]|jgi:uncharacterized protein (DUF1499 family)|nr:DUF1499 domain-containing protein [Rhodobiaceae bacterium]MBT7279996.1 DUF1499 domain-containing protein [Rhodobiaceae bacterium]MDG2496195.1 DUF1499 domain-containing protein [Alphaproteobacteria bacterium]
MLGISVATLTTWGLRLAIAAPVIALVLLALFRFGVMDFRLPLLGVALAVLLAIVALLMGVMALIGGYGGDGVYTQKAVIAVVLAVVVLYAPLSTLRKGGNVPPIHDISTDLDHPPVFVAVPALRAASDNSLEIKAEVQAQQKAFYTELAPKRLGGLPSDNFAKALVAAEAMGWDIVAQDASAGTLEATATTALFGFKDDVSIRLSADAGATKVDMRSVSRVGVSDLGANAARIEAYFAALN